MELKQLNKDEHPVGTRLLARDGQYTTIFSTVYEITVREWSPSGQYVRIAIVRGDERWLERLPYVVEVLDKQ